jgi:hypothetical protein
MSHVIYLTRIACRSCEADWRSCDRFGGTADEEGKGITLDAVGNIYITGSFISLSFPVINNPALPNVGAMDIFLLALNPSGVPIGGVR